MKTLLENRFAPLTFSWGFLEAPLHTVATKLVDWKRSLSTNVAVSPLNEPLAKALLRLEPLITPPQKELMLETRSSWTAYFDNGSNGGDPMGAAIYLSQQLKVRGLAVTSVPNTLTNETTKEKGTYGAVQFELFAPEAREFLNYERAISAANDGGKWVFVNEGTIQSFETPESYKARRVRDRFTNEMLEDYCRALGIELFDADFYGPEGVLVELNDPLPSNHVSFTLAEARRSFGLEP